ncbi:unnamed protein product [Sphenostylis stenocarpa]|uniref:PWWP domain-containing protein n=1 Tax=Sphenostylis stenocarpa TaxID=92480 RepID=A0AA86S471_9FABA|nr:unnamed protein product [Sphenostylis stenocarpa]
MAKKKTTSPTNNKKMKTKMIIHMPKHSQQPRSSPPKRRTDFSVFTRTPSSFSNPASARQAIGDEVVKSLPLALVGSSSMCCLLCHSCVDDDVLLKNCRDVMSICDGGKMQNMLGGCSPNSSSGEVRLSNVSARRLQGRGMTMKQFSEDTLVRCSTYEEGRPVCSSEFSDAPVVEVDSAVPDESLDHGGNRDASNEKNDISKMSESTALESSVSDSSSLAATPGSVVWARTDCQLWWPAEIVEETSAVSNPGSDGQVLVHFYGNLPSAWIDPMTDISNFEESFEARSNNPSEDFQQALKQALQKKAQLSSCQLLTADRSPQSDTQERTSASSEVWKEQALNNGSKVSHKSICKNTTSYDVCPLLIKSLDSTTLSHHNRNDICSSTILLEVTHPVKSEKKLRRLKIMRYLGLAAPIGSPF